MKIIVGLGNPGKSYEKTRHNLGYLYLEYLRDVLGFETWKDSRFHGCITEGILGNEKLLLLKPTTFMNLSGTSVESIVSFYKMNPKSDLLIISDDVDMVFGKVRFRNDGSHGGQNGLRDIFEKLGTTEISRIKIGIGRPEHMSVSDWVLSKLETEELSYLYESVFPLLEKKIQEWILS